MRGDFLFGVFLIFNSVIGVFSLLFGDRMWLLLEGSGVSVVLFQAYMVLVGVCVALSLVFVFFLIRRGRRVDKVVESVVKKEVVDDGRRLRVFEEIERNKKELERELERERLEEQRRPIAPKIMVQPEVIDGNTYYDNGYMDEFGVFHEYRGD